MHSANSEEYGKILQIKLLFEASEELCAENLKALRRTGVLLRLLQTLKCLCAGAGIFYGFGSLALADDLLWLGAELFILIMLGVLWLAQVCLTAFCGEVKFLNSAEIRIYYCHREAFAALKELSFPKDYMCSGFASAVLGELKRGGTLAQAYERSKCLEFDLCCDKSAPYIRANRDFAARIVEFEGIS